METATLYHYFITYPRVCIDSRNILQDSLFFALKGDQFDGNQFAAAALAQGAAYAIVDDPNVVLSERYLLVADVLTSLQQLASHYRNTFAIPVIGITGSNGKTTTKELVSSVLGTTFKVHYTKGNLNNHIGVPLTLLAMPADTTLAVIEMGANHQGEIAALCQIANPSHGIITNIGKAHLEGFGGIEGVKKGKTELYRFLHERQGVVFVNQDAEYLPALSKSINNCVHYGQVAMPGSQLITMTGTFPFVTAHYQGKDGQAIVVQSQLTGTYNFANIATAIAVGLYFGVADDAIQEAIASYAPDNMRSQIIESGQNRFILDAYNANPTSTKAAVVNFAQYPDKHKIVILGDMLELGDYSESEHADIVQLCLGLPFEQIILVGSKFALAATGLAKITLFENVASLKKWFNEQDYQGYSFLIKGSRGIRLEQLLTD
jgi:UDP-N-acetylmuramoyl-tripeptide--D-alanyl-D-alanine ligase